MPTFKDIKAKNAQFAASARENAGKPRIRSNAAASSADAGEDASFEAKQAAAKRGRSNVRPARRERNAAASKGLVGGSLRNNKLALGLIVFVVIGGVFFELMRLFL
ncbi:hypothetical protein EX895_004685 [Sporisorium graminicola]|uniref:Stress-associated endoplasmic reticulum protein n=1 Tax=Sporisorium graminicola TaxID=280036 RepID=A0A4U7KRB2_9BASI|nr:hypothetical protein EX895_004685 [Sporisorium graminicola]TKY86536.1 hypothetical protein EX895_004685 [Sporisorium graminicola]